MRGTDGHVEMSRGSDNVAVNSRWPLTTGVPHGRYYCMYKLYLTLCLPKTEISVFVTECVFFTSTCYKLHICSHCMIIENNFK